MNQKTIPKKIQKLIEKIPENGACSVPSTAWESVTEKPRKLIAKINGSLEFVEYTHDGDWETIYMWDFENEPEKWAEHFDLENLPRLGKTYTGVFL